MKWRDQKRSVACVAVAAMAILFFVLAAQAGAQGCAMCYQNAAASGVKAQAALRHGILLLLAPALAIFGGIFSVIYRRR